MDFLKGISQVMQEAEKSNSYEDYSRVESELVKSREKVAGQLKELTFNEIRTIIQKLEKEQPLTNEDLDYIRLWIVGDAEGYLRMENNCQTWLEEYRRLIGVLKDYESKKVSVPELLNLEGILEDAARTAADIAHFLEDKERVQRFEKAVGNLDSADRKFIAQMLKTELES